MSAKTTIEWTERTWNPVTGCTKISPGCAHCYAERITERFHGPGSFERIVLHPERLDEPVHWRKPARVFVNSMSDLFHEDISDDFIGAIFRTMLVTPRHTFQILTKRPQRMLDWFSRFYYNQKPSLNVWLGVSVENQHFADERIPLLMQTPAAVRFISAEPLLEKLSIVPVVDWVICGGESGPGARPMHPEWARTLRDRCVNYKIPFFFKQWGEWGIADGDPEKWIIARSGEGSRLGSFQNGKWLERTVGNGPGIIVMNRVGKKKAGRLLDGREWNEYPGTKHSV